LKEVQIILIYMIPTSAAPLLIRLNSGRGHFVERDKGFLSNVPEDASSQKRVIGAYWYGPKRHASGLVAIGRRQHKVN
jgi:hypothetical protein